MTATAVRVAVLLGNPNTGKTTLFNALSGLNHRVGNYPGVTVESKKGSMSCDGEPFELIDLPGTYSLSPRSPDEMVAVDVILGRQQGEARPDVVISLVDASNLERNLYLTTQALELGVPVVVALNMIDVAASQKIRVDADELSRRLGVPVVPIQANRSQNLAALRSAVARAASGAAPAPGPAFPPAFEDEVVALRASLGETPHFLVRRLLLDVGGYTEKRLLAQLGEGGATRLGAARERLQTGGHPVERLEARARYGWIRQAIGAAVQRPKERPANWTDRLDRVLTHPVWGTLVFLVVMFLLFESIFFAAKPLMDLIDAGKGWLASLVEGALPPGAFTSLLSEGVIGGVGAVLVFLPQIMLLFAFIAVLEDCGYMARAAFLMDRLMSRAGLSGKSFIPLLSSVACAVPGIMATRVIEDRRDRLATILVAPLMSCSARLPVYLLMTAAFVTPAVTGWAKLWVPGVVIFAMYLLGLVLAPLVALVLKRTLLRGATPVFVMEMPSYKVPSLATVARRVWDASGSFVRRAGTVILASMVLVWALLYFPAGGHPAAVADFEAKARDQREQLARAEDHWADEIAELAEVDAKLRDTPDDPALLARRTGLKERLLPVERLQMWANYMDLQAKREQLAWKRESYLGRLGLFIEPAVRPLGWDWRVGVAALASFPAREVVVGTLGVLFQEGKVDSRDEEATKKLGEKLMAAKWESGPREGEPLFTLPAALSLMVFFALCCQCASTLAVIRRETRSWAWPAFTFVYMTALAYVGALVVYQVGSLFV